MIAQKYISIIVAALTLVSCWHAARGEETALVLERARSRFANYGGYRVHYKSLGEGATAVVFVHGWTCDMTFWRSQVAALAGKTRIIAIDLPGHGTSDKPKIDYTIDLFARAVDAVLQDAGVESAVLVGHSMGTPVIRQFYRLFPNKTQALVAVDGSLRAFDDEAGEFDQLIARLEGPDFAANHARFVDGMFVEKSPPEVRKSIKAALPSAPQHVAVRAMKAMRNPAIWKDDPIKVPLQLILARNPFWSAEYEQYVRKLAPHVDYRVMDDVGHFLMLEAPERFNATLAEFLRQQEVLKP